MTIRILKNQKKGAAPLKPDATLPSSEDLDAIAAEEKAKAATEGTKAATDELAEHPLSTSSAEPVPPEQTPAPGAAPDPIAGPPSFLVPNENVQWNDPLRPRLLPCPACQAPKGEPCKDKGSEMKDFHAQRLDEAQYLDSAGNLKGDKGPLGPRGETVPADVQTEAQRQAAADAKELKLREGMASTAGVDSIGNQKVNAAPHIGPRGKGAPQDSFHGARAGKR